MTTAPFFKIVLFYLIGLLIGKSFSLPLIPLYFLYGGLIFLTFFLLRVKVFKNFCLVLLLILTGWLVQQVNLSYPPSHLYHFPPGKKYRFQGIVASDPVTQGPKTSFTVKLEKILSPNSESRVAGNLHLVIKNCFSTYQYGERIVFTGRLRVLSPPTNPGQFNYQKVFATRRLTHQVYLKNDLEVEKRGSGKVNRWLKLGFRLKKIFEQKIESSLPPQKANLLKALLLGEREKIALEERVFFEKSGTLHILAVSGLHVGLSCFFLYHFLFYLRVPRKVIYYFLFLFLGFFCFITGGRASTLRASLMTGFFLLAKLLERETNLLNILSLSALILLVANPNFLFDPGFQLSFTAVLSFVYIYPFFARKETALLTEKKGFFKQYLRQLFLGSLSVFLGLLPLQIYYFHSFHLWTILANLAVIPLVTVALGIGLFLISLPYLDSFLGFLNNFVLEGVLKTAAFFSRLPFTAISLAQPAFFFLPLAYFFLLLLFRPSLSGKNKVWLILLIPFLIFSLLPPDKFSRNLEAVFFDLGLGEAVYIKIPSGKNILIDGGGQFSAQKGAGLKVILPYLKSKGRNKINLIIVSHPHPDHLGGILEILEKVQVKLIALRREEKYRIPLYQNLLKKAEEKQIPLRFIEGEEILFISPAVKIKFFPPPPLEKKMERDSFINNRSLVFKLVYKNISFLFTGDIEKEAEEFLARTFPQDLRSTFLKIAHHGSQTSSGQQFLELVSPKVGILTTPPHWSSLPHPLVLARIEKFSFPLYRTDQYGAIIIQTDGERFKVKMMKKVDKKGKKGYN